MLAKAKTRWLSCLRRQPAPRLRMFCFPYAGGGASAFRRWQAKLPQVLELCPVQLPGREERLGESALTNIRQIAEAAADALDSELDLPFAVFGHSMGALIAFEFCDAIRARGYQAGHLIVSAYHAPTMGPLPRLTDLSDEEFVDELKRLNGSPASVFEDAELLQLFLPILRADFHAVDTYHYSPREPLSCPITTIGGIDDGEFPPNEFDGWRLETSNDFNLRLVPGDHFFLGPSEDLVLAYILEALRPQLEGMGSSSKSVS